MSLATDTFGRPLRSLRISVTDRCNLRCQYCMPEESYVWLERAELLSFEEMARLAAIFAATGVDKFRLTGGEPLLRRGIEKLVVMLASTPGLRDLALTTNGILLERYAGPLRAAGLQRVTVSLDTLRPERFRQFTRRDLHPSVLAGIAAARAAGFEQLKINTVVIRGFNDDELVELIEFGRQYGAEVRFIEYMDVGGALRWSPQQVVSRAEMLRQLERRYGRATPLEESGSAPADRYRLPDGAIFGVISSTTQPFCGTCDRARLTADGMMFLCLYASQGIDLKRRLRAGEPEDAIASAITAAWRHRADRGAEERLRVSARGVLFPLDELRKDPHREMHTRGG